jgi:hypothetical protein
MRDLVLYVSYSFSQYMIDVLHFQSEFSQEFQLQFGWRESE